MSKLFFDYDPMTGVTEHFEATDDGFNITYSQDVEGIIESNKERAKEKASRKNEFRQVAEIPITLQMDWLVKHGIDVWNPDHMPGVKRLLNDPDYRYLKTQDIII